MLTLFGFQRPRFIFSLIISYSLLQVSTLSSMTHNASGIKEVKKRRDRQLYSLLQKMRTNKTDIFLPHSSSHFLHCDNLYYLFTLCITLTPLLFFISFNLFVMRSCCSLFSSSLYKYSMQQLLSERGRSKFVFCYAGNTCQHKGKSNMLQLKHNKESCFSFL